MALPSSTTAMFSSMTVTLVLSWALLVSMPFDGPLWDPTLPLRFGKFNSSILLYFYLALNLSRKTDAKQNPYYARVLYSGQPVQTVHGELDWINLSSLIDIMSPYVPENITALCG